ncbi:hypothetical protein FQN50_000627 [Emmonsiellopsis sp. PD_5]|nr:hypothetical protein FQN50_000627 [Emmonsiellopsis sp. PD_5]
MPHQPAATGLAKGLVDKHAAEEPLKLYVQRTWITLEEKKIPYQYIEINPYDKSPSLLALNPKGLVPTVAAPLANGSKPIYESNIINEYLEDAYPNHTHLLPSDPYERARARIWIDFVSSRIIAALRNLETKRAEVHAALKEFTRAMDPEGPFFLGKEFGLPDVTLAPWVARFFVHEVLRGGVQIPAEGQGGEDEAVWARWRKWEAAVLARESVKSTMSEREDYVEFQRSR